MASLKEIKGRIASVSTTLKTTSAMKMVASAKLHKAQAAIGNMLPYEKQLHGILEELLSSCAGKKLDDNASALVATRQVRKVTVVAFSSNSSLCGGFNANAIREALAVVSGHIAAGREVTVIAVGRKMDDALRKAGFQSAANLNHLLDHHNYEDAAAFARTLIDSYVAGDTDMVDLVYNHYKSTSSQPTVHETYLPFHLEAGSGSSDDHKFIIEPGAVEVVGELLPKVLSLKIYTTLLDTSAAEHAARTVAMQTATDNGNEILEDLTLQYNKSRQQKITSEILDIVGGSLQ